MNDDLNFLYEDWQQELFYIESYSEYLKELEMQEIALEEQQPSI